LAGDASFRQQAVHRVGVAAFDRTAEFGDARLQRP